MNRNKNLAYAVAAFLAVVYVGWGFFGKGGAAPPSTIGAPSPTSASPAADGSKPSMFATPLPDASPALAGVSISSSNDDRSNYALLESDVTGLPPDAPPGTRLQLWVAWDPPVTNHPKLQLLIRDVILDRIIRGFTPEAPTTILLSIRSKDVADMLWADRYGALSVVVD
ncbi:MAG: hypothetical protein LC808_37750 [Actinobacteria bacterium]|nr:hypothetical protein [Actinomycetota bacterium]